MIYWRLLLLAIVIAIVCLLNLPSQVAQIEYALSHNRTVMLERELLNDLKEVAKTNKISDRQKYVERLENLGWVYFQLSKVNEAESTFRKEEDICTANKSAEYDVTYAHSLLNIATYYRERANFERADFYFNKIRDYDAEYSHVPDMRRARDLANLGLLNYLRGESIAEADKRAEVLCRAESFCESALDEYRLLPDTKRSQGDVLATQALVLRDLGLVDRAAVTSKQSKEILEQANNKSIEP